MGYELDHNDEKYFHDAALHFKLMEYFTCAYFALEILIRFVAFQSKVVSFANGWFLLDSIFVLFDIVLVILDFFLVNDARHKHGIVLRLRRLMRLVKMAR